MHGLWHSNGCPVLLCCIADRRDLLCGLNHAEADCSKELTRDAYEAWKKRHAPVERHLNARP